MKTNEEILKARISLYNEKTGVRVGDWLELPHGEFTRFTHAWDDHIQTGGGSGGYYLGNGYLSYSGGLDSGIKRSDIIPTEQTKRGNIWFFDKDISGAGRGVYFDVEFRVFKCKEDTDLSGLPQIEAHEKRELLKSCETITRINGNGNPYTLPVPEIAINMPYINEFALKHIFENTGLEFKKGYFGYMCQPTKVIQITTLFLTYNYSSKYYNNATHSNLLVLTPNNE